MKPELDEISGEQTTGHEWNGIKELNTPIPRAFNIWLWASIGVAVLYWLLFPSFPYVTNALGGILGYSSREAVQAAVQDGEELRASAFAVFETDDIAALAEDPTLRAEYEDQFAVLYRDNCSVCHGRGAGGQPGFPNLTDDHWLWSGRAEEVEFTLRYGINANNDDTRLAEMPAIGRDEWLEKAEIADVIEYVLSLTAQPHDAEAAGRGDVIFADNCASCHNDGGVGGLENGAPDLTDDAWIYGGTKADIEETVQFGRAGVMPAWQGRLTDTEIRQLTLYLLWQSNEGP